MTYLQRSLLALVPIVATLLSASSAWADEPASALATSIDSDLAADDA